jgi:hypothetical protein
VGSTLLGAPMALNEPSCAGGTLSISNPSALLGKLNTMLYRGNTSVGKALLVGYASQTQWWYASAPVKITGNIRCGSADEVYSTVYNLEFQAGWNLVQQLENSLELSTTLSSLSVLPTGLKWLVQLEDNGVGVTPGPFGGADAGSTATRMRGKLGGWKDTDAAQLKLENNTGAVLSSTALSAAGEFDLPLPATPAQNLLEPLDLVQGCGTITSTPANPTGVQAFLEPSRNNAPLGVIAAGGRGFVVSWVYVPVATQIQGTESCPSGDGSGEEHVFALNFAAGWNIMTERVSIKNNNESITYTSGALPQGTQWYFEADQDKGNLDTGSTRTSLSGSLGVASSSLRLLVGKQNLAEATANPQGEVSVNLPAVPNSALEVINLNRAGCTGTVTVAPAGSLYGELQLEVWNQGVFKSPLDVSNEDSDGALETISWWYVPVAMTLNGTQSCSAQVNRTVKYNNLALQQGWNLLIEREEENVSGERTITLKTAEKVPDGTAWGTN